MSRQYRPPRYSRRVPDRCQKCSVKKPPTELFFRVDGNNESITRHAPVLCLECYNEMYHPERVNK